MMTHTRRNDQGTRAMWSQADEAKDCSRYPELEEAGRICLEEAWYNLHLDFGLLAS